MGNSVWQFPSFTYLGSRHQWINKQPWKFPPLISHISHPSSFLIHFRRKKNPPFLLSPRVIAASQGNARTAIRETQNTLREAPPSATVDGRREKEETQAESQLETRREGGDGRAS